jgi:uncharacterized protein (DUF2147 family)
MLMRALLIAAGLWVLAGPVWAADPVEGEWVPQDGGSKVHIAACPDKPDQMCGKVSWLPAAQTKDLDAKNPKAALKTRPILGASTMWGLKQAAPGKWTGGKLYDPATGKTYDGKISANPNGTLKIEGCILMVCQAQTWKRG